MRIFLGMALLFLSWGAHAAESVDVKGARKNGITADWNVTYTEDSTEMKDLVESALEAEDGRSHLSVVTYETDNLPQIDYHADPNEAVLEFDITDKVSKTQDEQSPAERRTALFVATAKTALSGFSFVYFSDGPMGAAITASLISAALNLYYTWDPMRWGRFLEWGQDRINALLTKVKLKKWTESESSAKISRLITHIAGSIGFSFLFNGVLAWDTFFQAVGDPAFYGSMTFKGMLGVYFSGIWENVFTLWNDYSETKSERRSVRQLWRLKSLVSAVVVPLIHMDILPVQILAGVVGTAASYSLWKSKESYEGFNKMKSWSGKKLKAMMGRVKQFFGKDKHCIDSLTPKEAEAEFKQAG